MPAADLPQAEKIVHSRHKIKRGERLFSADAPFRSIYAIRSGFFKTNLIDLEGREQVTGFFMGGELLGMEGLGSGRCENNAIALEDSMVCAMPYSLIDEISRELPSLQRRLLSELAREITRGHSIMMLLGTMSADERLATFLVNLSRRFLRRGYSGSNFMLRMSRNEIGSYLGLKLETVSRLFSMFHKRGLLEVNGKQVRIADIEGLENVFSPSRLHMSVDLPRSAREQKQAVDLSPGSQPGRLSLLGG
jgi:CRP/FNR family transcriptional regulator